MLDDLVWNLLDVTLNLDIGELPSDQALSGEQGVLWVDNSLALCRDTDQTLTVLCECYDGRGCSGTYQGVLAMDM